MVSFYLRNNQSKVLLFALVVVFTGCAPVFSELQNARTVGEGNFELTPGYSSYNLIRDNGEKHKKVQENVSIQGAYGITSRWDLRFRSDYSWTDDISFNTYKEGFFTYSFGPKYSIIENWFSVYLPFSSDLDEDIDNGSHLDPTVLFTVPSLGKKESLDLNLSSKYMIPLFGSGRDDMIGINFGVSVSGNLKRWALMPEYGLLYNPSDKGHFSQLSLGFRYILRSHKDKAPD